MTVLITGGCGFVGLAVAEQLLARGDDVVLFDIHPLPALAGRTFGALPGRHVAVKGDVTAPVEVRDAMRRHGITRLLHAAAITADAARDTREPTRIAMVNLIGVLQALEAARDAGIGRIVCASTGALYGPAGAGVGEPLDESRHLPDPQSLYGITKFAAERAALRLRELWGIDIRVGRLAQVYGRWEYGTGERDTLSMLCRATLAALSGQSAVVQDVGPQDWIYSIDVARALIALLDAERPAHALYHLGAGMPFNATEWCERLARRYPDFRWRRAEPGETPSIAALAATPRTMFSTARLRELGYAPRYGIDEAFADYVAWLDAGGRELLGARPAARA